VNGATGTSDVEGKAARVAVEPSGSEQIQWSDWGERHGRLRREVAVERQRELPRYKGRDIAAACGQLRLQTNRAERDARLLA